MLCSLRWQAPLLPSRSRKADQQASGSEEKGLQSSVDTVNLRSLKEGSREVREGGEEHRHNYICVVTTVAAMYNKLEKNKNERRAQECVVYTPHLILFNNKTDFWCPESKTVLLSSFAARYGHVLISEI